MHFPLLASFLALLLCLCVHARVAELNALDERQISYFETPATITESNEHESEEDDFKPHEEDDDLNRGALAHRPKKEKDLIDGLPVKEAVDEDKGRPDDSVSFISKAFTSRKTFSCPRTKTDFVTGSNVATLNPEDIRIIAAMGDNIATGQGLWPQTSIEFRGAAFPIGGDASIDGLVTIPNILREFNEHPLIGVSHGMGSREDLPLHQLNVAVGGSGTADLPNQAEELVRRLKGLKDVNFNDHWTMVIITSGTEEVCSRCGFPDTEAINSALDILNRGIHKAFVVFVGPLYVSLASEQGTNLLAWMCNCTKGKTKQYIEEFEDRWEEQLAEVQEHCLEVSRDTFGVVVLPFLTVTSRYPSSLFVGNSTLLNRRGHNYAAKWLWNRMVGGPKYNLSSAILSRDKYFCPSVGCPYFRNHDNFKYCSILRHVDATPEDIEVVKTGKRPRRTQQTLYFTALLVVSIAFTTATVGCTVFYLLSKRQTHGRFDMLPVAEDGEYLKPRSHTVVTTKKEMESDSEEPLVKSFHGSIRQMSDCDGTESRAS